MRQEGSQWSRRRGRASRQIFLPKQPLVFLCKRNQVFLRKSGNISLQTEGNISLTESQETFPILLGKTSLMAGEVPDTEAR